MRRMIAVLAVLGACGGPAADVDGGPSDALVDVSESVTESDSESGSDAEGLAFCGADKVQDLLGQPVSGLRDRFPEDARIIPPNGLITQDYRPNRMNVDLDASGAIARIWCG